MTGRQPRMSLEVSTWLVPGLQSWLQARPAGSDGRSSQCCPGPLGGRGPRVQTSLFFPRVGGSGLWSQGGEEAQRPETSAGVGSGPGRRQRAPTQGPRPRGQAQRAGRRAGRPRRPGAPPRGQGAGPAEGEAPGAGRGEAAWPGEGAREGPGAPGAPRGAEAGGRAPQPAGPGPRTGRGPRTGPGSRPRSGPRPGPGPGPGPGQAGAPAGRSVSPWRRPGPLVFSCGFSKG